MVWSTVWSDTVLNHWKLAIDDCVNSVWVLIINTEIIYNTYNHQSHSFIKICKRNLEKCENICSNNSTKKDLRPHVYEVQTQLLALFGHHLSSISSCTKLYFQFMINHFSIRPYLLHFLIVNFKLMVNVFIRVVHSWHLSKGGGMWKRD